MKKLIIAAAFVVAVVAAAVVALPVVETFVASGIKTQMEQDGTVSVGTVEVGLLDRRLALRDVRTKQAAGLSVARWEATGLNWPLGELLHGRTPLTGYRLGDPLYAKRIAIDSVRLEVPGGHVLTVGSMVLDDFDLARFDGNVPPGPLQATMVGARFIEALSVGHTEERNVIDTVPVVNNTLGFRSFTGDGLDRGKLASFALLNFEGTAKDAVDPSVSLESLKGDGFDVRQILKTMSQPGWRPGMPAGRIGLEHVDATGFGGEVLKRYGISLGSISIATKHDSVSVTRSTTKLEGFVMAPPATGLETLQARMVMLAMGLKELRLALDCGGVEDRGKGELALDHCALSGPDLGQLDFTAKLVDADAAFWRAIDSGNFMGMYATKAALGDAKLVFDDKGLLDRGLRALGAASGQPAVAMRANLATQVRRYQPPNVLITDDMTKLLNTVADFIEKGGTLTVEAKPDPPFGLDKFGLLRQPGPDLISLLGVTASVSKK